MSNFASRHRTAQWGLLISLIGSVALVGLSAAAGLKRAARSEPKPEARPQLAKAETAAATQPRGTSPATPRTTVIAPSRPTSFNSLSRQATTQGSAEPGFVSGVGVRSLRGDLHSVIGPASAGPAAPAVRLAPAPSPPTAPAPTVPSAVGDASVGVRAVRSLAPPSAFARTDTRAPATHIGMQPRAGTSGLGVTREALATTVQVVPEPAKRTVILPGPREGTQAQEWTAAPGPTRAGGPAGPATSSAGPAGIGTDASALTVTPESAARLAVKNSLDLEITAADIREAEAQVTKAFGLDDFRLTASAMYGLRGPIASFTLPGSGDTSTTIKMGDKNIRQEQLQLVKPLYTHKKIERVQDVALRSLETRKLSKAVVERALDLAARQTAYGVLRAAQMSDVAQQRATAVAAHLDLTKKLRDAGVVAKFEVVQGESELARAQGDVIAARTGVEMARSALKRVLTLPQETRLEVEPGTAYEAPPGDQTALIEDAWEQRPEVHAMRSAIALAEANLRLAFASRNVSVSLVGSLTNTQASFGSEPWGWQVAIAAEKPIFDGKDEKSEVKAAKAKLDAAKLEVEKTRQEIALEVSQSYLALDEARQRLVVAQQGIVEAEERLRIAKVRYENGIALGIEVLDAQTAFAASRAEVVDSQYRLQLGVAQLRSAVGLWSGNEEGEL